jgi:hypothetical protein
MSASKVATSLFKSGPVDALLTVDHYKQKQNVTLNNIPDVLKNFSTDAAATLRKNPAIMKSLMKDVQAFSSGRLSKTDVLLRVGKSMGSTGLIKTLTGGMQNTMFDTFEKFGVSKGTVSSIMGATKTGVKAYMSGNLDDVRGLAGLARELTGKSDMFSVFDLAAEAAMASTIIDYAIRSGATDLIDEAVKSTSHSSVKYYAYREKYPVAVLTSNISALKLMGEGLTSGGVLGAMPDACKRILMFYKFADNTTPAQYAERTTELLDVLNHINPNWAKYDRNGEQIDNLEMFTYASPHATVLLGQLEQFKLPMLIAPQYRSAQLSSLVKQWYPLANI